MDKAIISKPITEIVDGYIRLNSSHFVKNKYFVIQVGDDPGSTKYIELKRKAGEKFGVGIEHIHLDTDSNESAVIILIQELNSDRLVSGIMIQSPIKGMDLKTVSNMISPEKDFDGMSQNSIVLPAVVVSMVHYLEYIILGLDINAFEKLLNSENYFTERDELLRESLLGRRVCIVNDSIILGLPMGRYLKSLGVQVDICNKETKDISAYTKNADVLVTATGVKGLIKGAMVKQNAIILDAGFPAGDIDVATVENGCKYYTPVPGGVGPLTVSCLFENIVRLGKMKG